MNKRTIQRWLQSMIAVFLSASLFMSGCAGAGSGSVSETSAEEEAGEESGEASDTDSITYKDDGVDYSRAMAQRSQSSEDSDPEIVKKDPKRGPSRKSWTVMIYMIGSNLESRQGCATSDLEEIDDAGLNFENFNVVVYTGGSVRWVGNVPCSQNSVLDMSLEGDERIVAATRGNANMGLPETLSDFLTFCDENYPAEHNALIFWDHGAGPLWGYGSDELYDGDSLMLTEMRSAMDASPFSDGRKLDLVGFDACLMASLESMTIWSDYADYYVGSEELEPGDGWNYGFLKSLEDSPVVRSLTESILSRFEEHYAGKKSASFNPDLTLSCVDLSRVGEVNAAIDALGDKMVDGFESGNYAEMVRDRSDSKSFGMAQNTEGEVSFYYDLVDIADLAEHMKDQYPEESAALIEKVKGAVKDQYANVDGAGGMTLYFPCKNKGQFAEMNAYYAELQKEGGYTRYLSSTGDEWLRSKSRDWSLGEPVDNGDEYTLQLTEDQIANMSGASYTILKKSEDVGYVPYMENCKIEPDKEGVLHLKKNMQVAVIRKGTDTELIRAKEVESDRKRAVYATQGIGLRSDLLYIEHILDLEAANATIKFMKNKKSGEVEIQDIALDDGVSGISGGKTSINISDWEGIVSHAGGDIFIPARDGAGRLRPFREWIHPKTHVWTFFAVGSEVGIDLVDASEMDNIENLVCQIQIEDINGEKYGSELVPAAGSSRETAEIDTETGRMWFTLYEDHAELSDYNGRDPVITVPETVSGLPVTRIQGGAFSWISLFDAQGYDPVTEITLPDSITEVGESAFGYCYELEKIHFPAGLKTIGDDAFLACRSLTAADLPDGVESIGKGAFAGCRSLTEFRISKGLKKMGTGAFMGCSSLKAFTGGPDNGTASGENPVLDADGAVYTADGTVLLAYPGAAAESFTVREGTKTIAYGAFEGASLNEVILPESLTEIGNYAFYNCAALKAPVFHEGLKKIGMHAFSAGNYSVSRESIPAEAEVIRIPASVETIAAHAFDKFLNVRFEVSEDNIHYTAEDGALMNKAGDTVHSLAVDPDGTALFPEGTIAFDEEVLSPLDANFMLELRNIYLPASMTKFPEEISDYRNKDQYAFYHCPSGSEAEKFAIRLGLNYTNEMDRSIGSTEVKTPKGTLFFDLYEDHAVLVGYSGEDSVVEIPSQAEGMDVEAVGNGREPIYTTYIVGKDTGREAPNLTKLVIPEGITTINSYALEEVHYTTEVIFPTTITHLGRDAMSSTTPVKGTMENLEVLEANSLGDFGEAPFVVTPGLRYIDPEAFATPVSSFEQSGVNENYSVRDGVLFNADGTELVIYPIYRADEAYAVPEGTVSIGKHAFSRSWNLKSVSLPGSLKMIGDYAFSDCSQLSEITFDPETELEEIKKRAFSYCASLTEISLPGSLKMVGDYAFYGCDQLSEITFDPETELEEIKQYAFHYCESLTEVTLPVVREIGYSAFSNCEMLSKVHFSEGTRTIGDCAFSNTLVSTPEFPESLVRIGSHVYWDGTDGTLREGSAKTIRIPANVTEIGNGAFASIGNTAFEVDPENTVFSTVDGILMDKDKNELIACPSGKQGRVVVPEETTCIDGGAFSDALMITDIEIPDSVEYIGSTTFEPSREEDENGEETLKYSITIHCNKGSYAERFAQIRGIPCEAK